MKNLNVIYLASGKAILKSDNVIYNDLYENRDLKCDMFEVDLSDFGILIASPPCNYYSRANYRRDVSSYALATKDLLPKVIDLFISTGKPFMVENVRNDRLFKKLGLYDKNCFIYKHGRHTYWTNIMINFSNFPQEYDFKNVLCSDGLYHCYRLKSYVQGGKNVNDIFDYFIEYVRCLYLRENKK